jgi:protein required for attachment to host cells
MFMSKKPQTSTTWILIANACFACLYETRLARLFNTNGHAENSLTMIKSFNHEQSRKRISELVSDRQGSYIGGTAGHGSFSEHSDPKLVEADRFARELAHELDNGRLEGKYGKLIIVAKAHFRGLLQKHMNHQLEKCVERTIEKDYTHFKGRELVAQLQTHL